MWPLVWAHVSGLVALYQYDQYYLHRQVFNTAVQLGSRFASFGICELPQSSLLILLGGQTLQPLLRNGLQY